MGSLNFPLACRRLALRFHVEIQSMEVVWELIPALYFRVSYQSAKSLHAMQKVVHHLHFRIRQAGPEFRSSKSHIYAFTRQFTHDRSIAFASYGTEYLWLQQLSAYYVSGIDDSHRGRTRVDSRVTSRTPYGIADFVGQDRQATCVSGEKIKVSILYRRTCRTERLLIELFWLPVETTARYQSTRTRGRETADWPPDHVSFPRDPRPGCKEDSANRTWISRPRCLLSQWANVSDVARPLMSSRIRTKEFLWPFSLFNNFRTAGTNVVRNCRKLAFLDIQIERNAEQAHLTNAVTEESSNLLVPRLVNTLVQ